MPKFDTAQPAAAAPADPNKVVLTIGDEKITEAQFDELINSLPEQYQQAARTMQKRQFAEQIVQVKLLAQEAEKKKLDQEPKTKETLLFQRQNLLAQAMFQELQKGIRVDDAAVEKYYNEHKSDYEVLKAKHILIRVKGAPMQAIAGQAGIDRRRSAGEGAGHHGRGCWPARILPQLRKSRIGRRRLRRAGRGTRRIPQGHDGAAV